MTALGNNMCSASYRGRCQLGPTVASTTGSPSTAGWTLVRASKSIRRCGQGFLSLWDAYTRDTQTTAHLHPGASRRSSSLLPTPVELSLVLT